MALKPEAASGGTSKPADAAAPGSAKPPSGYDEGKRRPEAEAMPLDRRRIEVGGGGGGGAAASAGPGPAALRAAGRRGAARSDMSDSHPDPLSDVSDSLSHRASSRPSAARSTWSLSTWGGGPAAGAGAARRDMRAATSAVGW